jgi:hypothetical protein|tara:strand:- start:11942 stop:12157 length:216 start_codon:yes stop_codon:yes gene_type:complete
MPAPDGYTTPTIPGMDDLAGRKTWFETGDGKPVKPSGYDSMASDDPQKVKYDSSVTENTSQLAALQALIDA